MIKSIFKNLFKKWETIYFTHDINDYYKLKGKLVNANIETKTKNISGGFSERNGHNFGGGNASYEILVKEEDIYRANEIIHNC